MIDVALWALIVFLATLLRSGMDLVLQKQLGKIVEAILAKKRSETSANKI